MLLLQVWERHITFTYAYLFYFTLNCKKLRCYSEDISLMDPFSTYAILILCLFAVAKMQRKHK